MGVILCLTMLSMCCLLVDLFKLRLDKFLALQDIMFDWTTDLTGTGNRSEYIVEIN